LSALDTAQIAAGQTALEGVVAHSCRKLR
jgi:hypothetical protein